MENGKLDVDKDVCGTMKFFFFFCFSNHHEIIRVMRWEGMSERRWQVAIKMSHPVLQRLSYSLVLFFLFFWVNK